MYCYFSALFNYTSKLLCFLADFLIAISLNQVEKTCGPTHFLIAFLYIRVYNPVCLSEFVAIKYN